MIGEKGRKGCGALFTASEEASTLAFVSACEQEAQGVQLRDEALGLLDKRGKLLDIALALRRLVRMIDKAGARSS